MFCFQSQDNIFNCVSYFYYLDSVFGIVKILLFIIFRCKWFVYSWLLINKFNRPEYSSQFFFKEGFIFRSKVVYLYWKNPVCNITTRKFNLQPELILRGLFDECFKLMLPSKGFWITICS